MKRRVSILELASIVLAEIEAVKPIATGDEVPVDCENLALWLLSRCVFRDFCFGDIGSLHRDYAEWRRDRGEPLPLSRRSFVAAFQAEGFTVSETSVHDVIRECDLIGHESFPD